jgi:ubiquinone/menaquinone biosynthesis C-methylase UbiE
MSEISSHILMSHAKAMAGQGRHNEALQILSATLSEFPDFSVEIMTAAYDIAQAMPDKSRYAQYQSRYFDFGIKPGDKVLDMGSGHIPFPLATHLADIALEDHSVGRAGVPFKHVDGKPVYECSVEKTPFGDKEFDFVYCSHVLEHVQDPEAACRELMRIGKRGYIECPTRGKDTFFATAKASNHLWAVECLNGELIFTEYREVEREGITSSILVDMTCAPQTAREKAIAALEYVKAPHLNVMMLWEGHFTFSIRRLKQEPSNVIYPLFPSMQKIESIAINGQQGKQKYPHVMALLSKCIRALRVRLAKCIAPDG